jgi:hypothetical protein
MVAGELARANSYTIVIVVANKICWVLSGEPISYNQILIIRNFVVHIFHRMVNLVGWWKGHIIRMSNIGSWFCRF